MAMILLAPSLSAMVSYWQYLVLTHQMKISYKSLQYNSENAHQLECSGLQTTQLADRGLSLNETAVRWFQDKFKKSLQFCFTTLSTGTSSLKFNGLFITKRLPQLQASQISPPTVFQCREVDEWKLFLLQALFI